MSVFASPFPKDLGKSTIKVYVRTRPLLEKEILEDAHNILTISPADNQVLVEDGTKGFFSYDGVCGEGASQKEVFEMVLSPLLGHMKEGQQVTVIAYGQTSSGKTYTMGTSTPQSENDEGMLQRVMKVLLDQNSKDTSTQDENECSSPFYLKLSFMEIYNESIFDLFSCRNIVTTKPDGFGGVIPVNCQEEKVLTTEEGLKLLEKGNHLRKVASTAMNSHSSRSHALISLSLYQKQNGVDVPKGRLRLVDLAGAEGVGRNNTGGKGFGEGVSINKGLLAVGKVLAALSSNSSASHIPYRESIVTRLLRDALGGNSYTSMITCVSPASTNLSVTLNTLRYAEQARSIRNKPTVFSTLKKRKGVKRNLDDISATPSAFKKFLSLKGAPYHNSTICTPGHKPPISKLPPLNNTFNTPLSRTSDFQRSYPRSSSKIDLTADFHLPQPVFEEEMSPSQSIICEPRVDNTFLQISPLVERVNSRFEQSFLHYEQRFQNQMKDLEDRIAEKVANLITRGSTNKRRSKRLLQKNYGEAGISPDGKELTASSDASPEDRFSLANSIADALLKRKTFQSVLKGDVKVERDAGKENFCSETKNVKSESQPMRCGPLMEISNLNHTQLDYGTVCRERDGLPLASTIGCAGKIVRRSNRLRSLLPRPRSKRCSISPLHGTISPSGTLFSTEETVIYDSENSSSDLETTVIYQRGGKLSGSPDLRETSTLQDKLPGKDKTCHVPKERSTRRETGNFSVADSTIRRSLKNVSLSDSVFGAPMFVDSPPNKAPSERLRRSSRRSALIATQRNFDLLNAKESPLRAVSRRTSKAAGSSLNKSQLNKSIQPKASVRCNSSMSEQSATWELVISPTLQKQHSKEILKILNSANLRELQKLPTIGPKTAMVIYNFRKMYGKLKCVEDIKEIPGLPKSYYSRFMKANLMHHINI